MEEFHWVDSRGLIRGVLCCRAAVVNETAVVMLNAGQLMRTGPHLFYVELARSLARIGIASLRLDFQGLGESRRDFQSNDRSSVETQEQITRRFLCGTEAHPGEQSRDLEIVLDELQRSYGLRKFVVLGMCSSGTAALSALRAHPGVVGSIILNGRLPCTKRRDEIARRARARGYWGKLFDWQAWGRLLSGQSRYRELVRVLAPSKREREEGSGAVDTERLWRLLADSQKRCLFIYGSGSHTFDEYLAVHKAGLLSANAAGSIEVQLVKGADHTFTPPWSRDELIERIARWMLTWIQ